MRHKFLLLYVWFVRTTLYFLPDQPLIMRFRGFVYSLFMAGSSKNFQVSASVVIRGLEKLSVGADVYLAPRVIINARDKITLESQVMIGFNSVIVSGNHSIYDGSYRFGPTNKSPIFIGYGTWVSANCTITAGVVIGSSCLIAANSAVVSSLSGNSIYGGVPAKFIKNSFNE